MIITGCKKEVLQIKVGAMKALNLSYSRSEISTKAVKVNIGACLIH
jgi:hypothetical protein